MCLCLCVCARARVRACVRAVTHLPIPSLTIRHAPGKSKQSTRISHSSSWWLAYLEEEGEEEAVVEVVVVMVELWGAVWWGKLCLVEVEVQQARR